MTSWTPTISWRLRVAGARLQQQAGLAGLLGIGLLVLAVAKGATAWRLHEQFLTEAEQAARTTTAAALASPVDKRAETPVARTRWPLAQDVPTLLSRLERAAVKEGLGWPQADYRINPATAESPASLEVRCALKGPYPNIRSFLTAALLDTPTLAVREFNLSRPSADTPIVEAKLSFVVYLGGADETSGEAPK
ncbi:hypothetical protein HZ992_12230 [Rhizobacter sp. AJA081-3]|uniref:hypothetical protein n=1 Tax=Rhizobacter sp. AJA081-3 TaxID=2753607 RepID=UPI001AE08461|nr:hypothetical protein [Rhizobacter sp. AJA081-3]QTN25666.1 hypothetical protein HZ992_12230 [Rhizobacter sp. AJA081-3]